MSYGKEGAKNLLEASNLEAQLNRQSVSVHSGVDRGPRQQDDGVREIKAMICPTLSEPYLNDDDDPRPGTHQKVKSDNGTQT